MPCCLPAGQAPFPNHLCCRKPRSSVRKKPLPPAAPQCRHRQDTGDSLVVYLKEKADSHFTLELIWLKDGTRPESTSELHLAFSSEDMPGAKARHAAMNCICYEDDFLGLYFIMDPDGYWLCIMPEESPLQKLPAN